MTLQEQYRRERKRVRDYISRLKRQGYIVETELPKIPKRITAGSIRRLQKLTPEKISESATTYHRGRIISRREHRQIVNERNRELRRIKRETEKAEEKLRQERIEREKAREQRIKEDREQGRTRKRRKDTAEAMVQAALESGGIEDDFAQIVITRFQSYMLGYPQRVYQIVMEAINRAIAKYGVSAVAHAIEQTGDKVEHFLSGLYGQSEDEAVSFATEIIENIPDITFEEVKEIHDVIVEVE